LGDLVSLNPAAIATAAARRHVSDPVRRVVMVYRIERVLALAVSVALAPLMIAIAAIIVALSRQSPLIRHRRVGWRGEDLWMLKFRTMWRAGAPEGPLRAIEDLPDLPPEPKRGSTKRVSSRFAAFCRRYSLDEVPQLLHVVRGEMSFVGPRPITRRELDEHYGDCATEVLSLRPGLTGLWQATGRNRLSYDQRRRLDLMLVRRASPGLFLKILVRTIPRVVRGYGAC